ncbi:MAG: HD domain-containing protein [Endomicrobium sp.]|jgi:poly(A) polymerase|nr:HD domain-containing protein [Endomicrobium sp.]
MSYTCLLRKINYLSKKINVYIVGGFLRDLILKKQCKDIDLVTNKKFIESFTKKVANFFNTKLIKLGKNNETYRIVLNNDIVTNIDISPLNGKNIKEDLLNRDFTINAMAVNLRNLNKIRQNIISPKNINVFKDFKFKIINSVSTKSFLLDPLRMIRAFRIASELNFMISKNLLEQINANSELIQVISYERIKNEFFRILSLNNASSAIKNMFKSGLLENIFPIIKKMKMSDKIFYYHPNGLFQHSFETMVAAEEIINNLEKYFPKNFYDLKDYFNKNNSVFSENVTKSGILKFAAFFHDNAKPETVKIEKNNKIHFLNHEKLGAENISKIMLLLKNSRKDIEEVKCLINNHMRLSNLTRNSDITLKAKYKLIRDIKDNIPALIILSMSDWHSYRELNKFPIKMLKSQENILGELMYFFYETKKEKPIIRIIDGNIIMKKFGLTPSPYIGKLLKFINEKQINKKINNTEEAIIALKLKFKNLKLSKE